MGLRIAIPFLAVVSAGPSSAMEVNVLFVGDSFTARYANAAIFFYTGDI